MPKKTGAERDKANVKIEIIIVATIARTASLNSIHIMPKKKAGMNRRKIASCVINGKIFV
jgi:hypothetical protein